MNQFILIKRRVLDLCTPNKKPHILLAFSGGPDSVFLFLLLVSMKNENLIELSAAHLDHGWRKESHKDAKFCEHFARERDIKIQMAHAKNIKVLTPKSGSIEDHGRQMRLVFLEEARKKADADFIACAHHLDDQLETFFIRLARGASLRGLTCMRPKQGKFIRPMLDVKKETILNFLNENKIDYRIDPTNESGPHLRCNIRNKLIPALQRTDQRFNQKIIDTINILKEEHEAFDWLIQKEFQKIFYEKNGKLVGELKLFKELPAPIQKRLLMSLVEKLEIKIKPSNGLLEELLRFIKNPRGGCHEINGTFRVIKKEKLFWIT